MEHANVYEALMGLAPKRIPHWEHWSCPDAESYLTGIDYYEHPKLCREKLAEVYPQLRLWIPKSDDPIPKPTLGGNESSSVDEAGGHHVRWGDSQTTHWDWGKRFKTVE